jgi:hypothetical protein
MPPLDPEVLDLAPSDPALTFYGEQHAVTYMRLLDADAEGTASTRTTNLIGRDRPSGANLPAPDGWRGRDTDTCFDAAGLAQLKRSADKTRWPRRQSQF